jgi:poly-D-alanine transfer protein DltD
MIYFSEAATTGSSKQIKVYKGIKAKPNQNTYNEFKGKTVKTQIGRISFTVGNKFYYYEPPTNTSRPILIDEDLEILKKKVINRRNG